ncbi:hypothetical protein BDN72DRAFT_838168 [Pluteus cervinus]|uniref:Uncharacterized protein n=1 Tax=Pluteus cervinus TaxID=181527 RepID=A0ACD3AZA8_9AGAR|nr:hypothetical protein BDN72DRAFT_838168 [Pluteus cervinus]
MSSTTRTTTSTLVMMCQPAVHGPHPKSFEELRMEDYLTAYQATGRPPQPCPEQPTDDAQRRALGLPPVFQPFPENELTFSIQELQAAQPFSPAIEGDETYHSISCTPGYKGYSFEELRTYAYLKGFKSPPTAVPMDPFTLTTSTSDSKPPSTTNLLFSSNEQFQSIVIQPQFSQHSPEELRVAYLRLGRELNSEDILRSFGPTPINAMRNVSYVPPPPGGSLMNTNGTSNPLLPPMASALPTLSLFGPALGSTSTGLAPAATITTPAAPIAPAITSFGLFGSATSTPAAPTPTPAIVPPSAFGFTPSPLFAAPTPTAAATASTGPSFQFGTGALNSSSTPKFQFG